MFQREITPLNFGATCIHVHVHVHVHVMRSYSYKPRK